jgi:hypothetical protein
MVGIFNIRNYAPVLYKGNLPRYAKADSEKRMLLLYFLLKLSLLVSFSGLYTGKEEQ